METTPSATMQTFETTPSASATTVQKPNSAAVSPVSNTAPLKTTAMVTTNNAVTMVTSAVVPSTDTELKTLVPSIVALPPDTDVVVQATDIPESDGNGPATDATTAAEVALATNPVTSATDVPVSPLSDGKTPAPNALATEATTDAVAQFPDTEAPVIVMVDLETSSIVPATDAVAPVSEGVTQATNVSDEIKPVPDGPRDSAEVVTAGAETVATNVVPPTSDLSLPTSDPVPAPEAAVPTPQTFAPVPEAAPQPEPDVKTDSKPPSEVEEKSEFPLTETKEEITSTNLENKDKAVEAPVIGNIKTNNEGGKTGESREAKEKKEKEKKKEKEYEKKEYEKKVVAKFLIPGGPKTQLSRIAYIRFQGKPLMMYCVC
ncbi:uncharacterized protein LOC127423951 [Myxocyprinus asiaticus]|uniref:uncharacterized protein LOC127423951 n=1 Tax=Myxocyprinus asiaticus TaxID=70543 RepID=UPI002222B5F0|nr:uncharacterized protein LOC127423951 [Myxocyprinus asiaticus]